MWCQLQANEHFSLALCVFGKAETERELVLFVPRPKLFDIGDAHALFSMLDPLFLFPTELSFLHRPRPSMLAEETPLSSMDSHMVLPGLARAREHPDPPRWGSTCH